MPEQPITQFAPPNSLVNPSQGDTSSIQDEEYIRFFDWNAARQRIDNLIKDWKYELIETERRRKIRDIEVDIAKLHKDGDLKSDETLIPIRVIDNQIRKEQPPFINYLTQSRRVAIFKCKENPNQDVALLESSFTEGMTYSGWQTPFHKTLDGGQTHGWDSIEIEYRADRPLHCNIDHIGHENLIFPRDSKDLQAVEVLLRKYSLTIVKLKEFVRKYGFDKEQIDLIIARQKERQVESNIDVYKVYFKYQGVVFVCWYAEKESTDWLKKPVKLYLGRDKKTVETVPGQPIGFDPISGQMITSPPTQQEKWIPEDETQYPIVLFKYSESEKDSITDYKGRCFLDGPKQAAHTALWSILINGSVRAGNVYGSPANQQGTGGGIKKLDLTLEHGCFYSEPINFWHTEYPNAEIVRVTNALDTQTQDETGNLAAAVVNRDDSRKTAKEITTATNLTTGIASVRVLLWSIFLREAYTRCWLITQSQAQQGLIVLYSVDANILSLTYDIRAAGDVDVLERSEKLNRRGMLWPIVQSTPLAMPFLIDILKESLPEDASRYEQLLQQAMQQQNGQQQLIANMGNVIQHMALDDNGQVKPEFKQYEQQLGMLKQQVQQSLNAGSSQQPAVGNGQPQ